LLEISEITFADSRQAFRSVVHAKSHGIIRGELEVLHGTEGERLPGSEADLTQDGPVFSACRKRP
jgi:hypothetical protein